MSFESLRLRDRALLPLPPFESRSAHAPNIMPFSFPRIDDSDHTDLLRAASSVSSEASASSFDKISSTTSALRSLPSLSITSSRTSSAMAPSRSANKMAISNLLADDTEHGLHSQASTVPYPRHASPHSASDQVTLSTMSPLPFARNHAIEAPTPPVRFSSESNYHFSQRSGCQESRNRPLRSPLKRKSLSSRHRPPLGESKSKRPWTKAEDAQLWTLTQRLGIGLWAAIAEHIPFRTGKQVRERWLNHLSPDVHKRPWAPEEDRIIIEGHMKYGNSWSKICKLLEGRSENMCKNRFHCKLRKLHCIDDSTQPRV